MRRIGASLIAFLLSIPQQAVSAQATASSDWHTDSIRSTALGETRRIHVALRITHGAHAWSGDRYPVLIILDGSPSDLANRPGASTVFLSHMFAEYNHSYVSLPGAIAGLQSIFRPLSLMGQTEGFMSSSEEFLAQYVAVRARYTAAAPRYNLPARLPLMFTFNWADYLSEGEPTLHAAVPTLCAESAQTHLTAYDSVLLVPVRMDNAHPPEHSRPVVCASMLTQTTLIFSSALAKRTRRAGTCRPSAKRHLYLWL